jgi:asparagine synthase (glutamine-hydrolysing)
MNWLSSKFGWIPRPLRSILAQLISAVPAEALNHLLPRLLMPLISDHGHPGPVGYKLKRLAELMNCRNKFDLYRRLVSHAKSPSSLVQGAKELPSALTDSTRWPNVEDFNHWMTSVDLMSYLPDDILVKVDRASMGVSLEVRIPLLDHRLVEFALRLPVGMKIKNGQNKWLLRQVVYQYIPRNLIERPKKGFSVPIGAWLKGPLREWAEALLDEKRLREDGFFYPKPIRKQWEDHVSGKMEWGYYLWDVLMFQAWFHEREY